MEAVAAQQRQQQAVADFEAGRVTAAQAAASAEAPATGAASQDPHGAAAHATDASVPMAVASSCRHVRPATCAEVVREVRLEPAHACPSSKRTVLEKLSTMSHTACVMWHRPQPSGWRRGKTQGSPFTSIWESGAQVKAPDHRPSAGIARHSCEACARRDERGRRSHGRAVSATGAPVQQRRLRQRCTGAAEWYCALSWSFLCFTQSLQNLLAENWRSHNAPSAKGDGCVEKADGFCVEVAHLS